MTLTLCFDLFFWLSITFIFSSITGIIQLRFSHGHQVLNINSDTAKNALKKSPLIFLTANRVEIKRTTSLFCNSNSTWWLCWYRCWECWYGCRWWQCWYRYWKWQCWCRCWWWRCWYRQCWYKHWWWQC